ncbi:MAG: FadR/GntR family transcriptional regulator [Planctomycetota bacterium]|nr:FadR/GntR family transcriptional regulator [Planctomycetota bacterium]
MTNTQKNSILPVAKRETLVEAIAQNLINYIASNELQGGDRLPSERAMLEMIDASRLPLREAVCMLKGLGIIEARHGKGMFVKDVDLSKVFEMLSPLLKVQRSIRLEDILTVRFYIESSIAEVVAARRSAENIELLKRDLDQMRQTKSDTTKFIEHDMAFHAELAKGTGNAIFHLFMSTIADLIYQVQFRYPDADSFRQKSLAYHQRILDAVINRDGREAAATMQQHIKAVEAAICRKSSKS